MKNSMEKLSAEIYTDLQKVRKDLQASGFELTDPEFDEVLQVSCRKVRLTGMTESYLPFLVPDVIRETVYRREINNITAPVLNGCRT